MEGSEEGRSQFTGFSQECAWSESRKPLSGATVDFLDIIVLFLI
jgi:hypothetical protein